MKRIKAEADHAFVLAKEVEDTTQEGLDQKKLITTEARAGYDRLRRFWVDPLDNLFADIPRIKEHNPIVGMFANELEPSSQFTILFESEEDWRNHERAVKERLIQFGTRFQQSTVHLVDLYVSKPQHVQYGELVGDVTFQKKLWVSLNLRKMASPHTFDNFQLLKEIADSAGIGHLTADIYGRFAVLIYSIGRDGHVTFDEQCRRFIVDLANRNLISMINKAEDVALTNYGNSAWGASHTYEEALDFLKTRGISRPAAE